MKKIVNSNPEPETPKTETVPPTPEQPTMTASKGGGVKTSDKTTIIVIIAIIVVIGFLIYLNMQKKKDGTGTNATGNS